jgi:hypothetical protein
VVTKFFQINLQKNKINTKKEKASKEQKHSHAKNKLHTEQTTQQKQ